MKLYFPFKRK